jgi:hypothetical protein
MKNIWSKRLSVFGIGTGAGEVPPMVDMWGSPLPSFPKRIPQATVMQKLWYSTFNVAAGKYGKSGGKYDPSGKWIADPVSSEVYRLWRKSRDAGVVPSIPSRYLTLTMPSPDGKPESRTYKLNKKQYAEYSKLVGVYRYTGASGAAKVVGLGHISRQQHPGVFGMVSHEDYLKLSDKERIETLKGIYRVNKGLAKEEFLSKLGPAGWDMVDSKLERVLKPSGQILENSD